MTISSNMLTYSTLLVALVAAQPATAANLDAAALKELAAGQTWTVPETFAGVVTAWAWTADGKVCLRLMGSTSGKCDDEGTWAIVDSRICYQLTWWLKSTGMNSGCFQVEAIGDRKYDAKSPGGSMMFKGFSVQPS